MRVRLPTRTEVLDLLAEADEPIHAREIAKRFDIPEGAFDGLMRLLDNLVFDGTATVRGQRFKLAKGSRHARESREGYLTVNPKGFGFVASASAAGDDVFIPPDALGGAMHGDTVIVAITGRGSRGPEGRIERVVMRGAKRIAGILRRRGKSAWVEPDDARVRGPVVLSRALDAQGPEGNSGKDGDVVVVTITRYPEEPGENPEGRLEAVLGPPGELRVEAQKTLFLAQVDELHSPEAVLEAEAYGLEVPSAMLEGREDLTHLPLPTIDPEDARDHDDAVWVERTPGGGYRAFIAIADVSSYVRPGTKLDDEAKLRGCSIYLPDRAIPMLPRALSSNLCSLLPHVIRLCLCAEVHLDASGAITSTRLIRGFMKSQAKLTYGGVAQALGLTEQGERDAHADALRDGLQIAYDLSRILRTRRLRRGALDFELPEAKILLDPNGQPVDVVKRGQDPGVKRAYQLIEELMLLANEVVAEWLIERDIPGVFRVHLPPDEQKLQKLVVMCETLGVPFDLEEALDPKKLSLLLRRFAEHPLANVLNMLLLRSMKQAAYDISNLGHFGLASKAYLHFTSPIRRYPDLVVHRQVHAVLLGERIDRAAGARDKLSEAASASSQSERRAMEVEREVADLYRAVLMRDKIGQQFSGTVTGVTGSGVYVALENPFVDVMVKVEDLGPDSYNIDDDGLRVVAERSGDAVQLGDAMLVEIIDAAIVRRMVFARRVGGEMRRPTKLKKPDKRHKSSPNDPRGKNARKGRPDARRHDGGGAAGPKPRKGAGGRKFKKPGK